MTSVQHDSKTEDRPRTRPGVNLTMSCEARGVSIVSTGAMQSSSERIAGGHVPLGLRILQLFGGIGHARVIPSFARKRIDADEFSRARGGASVALLIDKYSHRMFAAAEGRCKTRLEPLREGVEQHGGDLTIVSDSCLEVSAPSLEGSRLTFRQSGVSFVLVQVSWLIFQALSRVSCSERGKTVDGEKTRLIGSSCSEARELCPRLVESTPAEMNTGAFSRCAPSCSRSPGLSGMRSSSTRTYVPLIARRLP